jgi:DNA-3-methyladenine glycosylase II
MRDHIKKHFRRVDPVLFAVIKRIPPVSVHTSRDFFSDLCEAIINQQLSEKAGSTIWNRFLSLFPEGRLAPESLLRLTDVTIRSVGTSRSKVSYLRNLARSVKNKSLQLPKLSGMPDQDVIDELTKVKGIGPWTAEMFLMFSLGREDVFSYGDLGLRNAIRRLYKFKKDPTRLEMENIVRKWSPYRTWAARILWKSLEL